DRVQRAEQLLRGVVAEDDDVGARARLGRAEQAAALHRVLADAEVFRGRGGDPHVLDLDPRVVRLHPAAGIALDGDERGRRQPGADRVGVLEREARAAPPLPAAFLRRADLDRWGAAGREGAEPVEAPGEVLLHVAVPALDHADDRDQEHDADDHADDGEEALELLRTDLRESEADALADLHLATVLKPGPPCASRRWRSSRPAG